MKGLATRSFCSSLSQFGKEKNRPVFVFFRGFVFVMMIRNDRSCSLAGVSLEKTYPGVAREQEEKKPQRETCRLASRPKWRDGRGGGYPNLKATFFLSIFVRVVRFLFS